MANKNTFNNDSPPAAGERPAIGEGSDKPRAPDGTQQESSAAAGDSAVGGNFLSVPPEGSPPAGDSAVGGIPPVPPKDPPPPPDPPPPDPPPPDPPPVETFTVVLRHKTPYSHYRRAGLLLSQQFKPYSVTAAQLAALKGDAWVELQKPEGPDKK